MSVGALPTLPAEIRKKTSINQNKRDMDARFMTRKQIERERRNGRIASTYQSLRREHPDVKPSRLLPTLAQLIGVSEQTCWKVLTDRGIYN